MDFKYLILPLQQAKLLDLANHLRTPLFGDGHLNTILKLLRAVQNPEKRVLRHRASRTSPFDPELGDAGIPGRRYVRRSRVFLNRSFRIFTRSLEVGRRCHLTDARANYGIKLALT